MIEQNLAILWDLDGTIVDTKEVHFSTWSYALNKFGFNLDRKVFDANFGRNNRTILPLFLGFKPKSRLAKQLVEEKEARFREIVVEQASLVHGVESWLEEAKQAKIPQVIASSAPLDNITAMISGYNLLQYFELFLSGKDLPAKPEPDVFLEAAKVIDRYPEQCLVIEDSLAGVKAAKKAGMTCIAVTTSHTPFELRLADLVLQDFTQPLAAALDKLGLSPKPDSEG